MSRFASVFLLCLYIALICGLIPATQFSGSPNAERIVTTLTANSHRHLLEKLQAESDHATDEFDTPPALPTEQTLTVSILFYEYSTGSLQAASCFASLYSDFQGRAPPTQRA